MDTPHADNIDHEAIETQIAQALMHTLQQQMTTLPSGTHVADDIIHACFTFVATAIAALIRLAETTPEEYEQWIPQMQRELAEAIRAELAG